MAKHTINTRQLTVLTWIGEGCPPGVYMGDSHKVSAAALRSRRLVKVSGHGPTWRADLTDAGRYVLEHGLYPEGHWTAPARKKDESAKPGSARQAPGGRPRQRAVRTVTPVARMLAAVDASGGRLEVKGDSSHWDNLAASASRYGKVPAGKILTVVRGPEWGTSVLVLGDAPDWMHVEQGPVAVPAQARQLHPVVAAVRDDDKQLPFARSVRQRALRILEALAREAGNRGHQVRAPSNERGYGPARGELEIVIYSHGYVLRMSEASDRTPHELTAKEHRDRKRYEHSWVPVYDYRPSGRLRLTIVTGWRIGIEKAEDTKTKLLEDKLGAVLQEIELRAGAAQEQALEAFREAERRQSRWEQVHAQAEAEAVLAYRTEILIERATALHQTLELKSYVEAVRVHSEMLPDDERALAEVWIQWAKARVSALNPLGPSSLAMPPDPVITADMLKPFMQGLSPYGPNRW
jgi:hypothetical protein